MNDLINKLNSLIKNKNNNLKIEKDIKYDLIRKTQKYFGQIKEEFNISFSDNDKDSKIFTNKGYRISRINIERDNLSYQSDLYLDKKYGRNTKITSPIYISRYLFPGVREPILCWPTEDIQQFYDKREIILKKIAENYGCDD